MRGELAEERQPRYEVRGHQRVLLRALVHAVAWRGNTEVNRSDDMGGKAHEEEKMMEEEKGEEEKGEGEKGEDEEEEEEEEEDGDEVAHKTQSHEQRGQCLPTSS